MDTSYNVVRWEAAPAWEAALANPATTHDWEAALAWEAR